MEITQQEENQEWYEDQEPEIDFNELNKAANVTRYANTVIIFILFLFFRIITI
jgi:hypothetical protein